MLLLSSCDKEMLEVAGPPANLPARTETVASQPHERAGAAFRQTMDTWLQTEPTTTEPATEGFSPADMSESELLRFLAGFADQGLVATAERDAMQSLFAYFRKYPFQAETPLADIKSDLDNFLKRENITPNRTPVVYHTALTVKEALFETQVSKLAARDGTVNLKGVDDGQLCRETGWFCPDDDWQNLGLTAAASAAAGEFRQDVNWGAGWELAAGVVIAGAIVNLYQTIFCSVECDACGPAVGVTRVFDGCNFEGIRAGGTFEFAERWIFKVDDNGDGVIDANFEVFENFVPASVLPSSPFEVIVDVACDGFTIQGWPVNEQTMVYISPNTNVTPLPTANLIQPPLSSGYYYPTNTQLCFSLSNLATQGNTFLRWESSGGGVPATSTTLGSYCVTFPSPTMPRSVNAVFLDPCTGQNRYITTSFLVCDNCN